MTESKERGKKMHLMVEVDMFLSNVYEPFTNVNNNLSHKSIEMSKGWNYNMSCELKLNIIRIIEISPNSWNLIDILPNNPWGKEQITTEFRKYIELYFTQWKHYIEKYVRCSKTSLEWYLSITCLC